MKLFEILLKTNPKMQAIIDDYVDISDFPDKFLNFIDECKFQDDSKLINIYIKKRDKGSLWHTLIHKYYFMKKDTLEQVSAEYCSSLKNEITEREIIISEIKSKETK